VGSGLALRSHKLSTSMTEALASPLRPKRHGSHALLEQYYGLIGDGVSLLLA
jgi:hypothetical protein